MILLETILQAKAEAYHGLEQGLTAEDYFSSPEVQVAAGEGRKKKASTTRGTKVHKEDVVFFVNLRALRG
jgi:hypothetical protein